MGIPINTGCLFSYPLNVKKKKKKDSTSPEVGG